MAVWESELNDADYVNFEKVGIPTYESLQDWLDTTQSAGLLCGGEFTDNTDGSITVDAGCGMVKTVDDALGNTAFFDWAENTNVALSDSLTNWIYIDYNNGSPTVNSTTDFSIVTFTTQFIIGIVYREGTVLHIIEAGSRRFDFAHRVLLQDFEVNGFRRASGLVIEETGTRNIGISEGIMYMLTQRTPLAAIDTSGSDTFTYYYSDGDSGWTEVTGQTQIDNVYYDDGDGTLGELLPNQFGVHWVFQDFSGHVYILYGYDSYKLSAANDAQPPIDVPPFLADFAFISGKVIIEKNASSFAEIHSAFDVVFTPSVIIPHNDLTDIQGGTTDEYYHLTAAEYAALGGGALLGSFDVSNWAPDTVKYFDLTTPADAIGELIVSVREQVPQVGVVNDDWSIETDDTAFDLYDSAYAVSVTPGATTGETTLTLASGVWAATDVGKKVVGNSGVAHIIAQDASDVATILISDDFTDTSAITSGNWQLYSGQFTDGSFTLAGIEQVDWDSWDGTADGAAAVFESAGTSYISSVTLDDTRVLVAYRDGGNSNYGTAIVLTIGSDNAITPGTPIVFESINCAYNICALINTDKVIVCYAQGGGTSGRTCVLSVSETTITPGTPVEFENASINDPSVCKIDTDKAIVTYADVGNSNYDTACVLEISDTTITPGSPQVLLGVATSYLSIAQLDTDKAIVCFTNAVTTGDAYVLTITGTSIAKGASATYESANVSYNSVASFSSTKAIVGYTDVGNSSYGTACILDISGTTITPGTPIVFESAITSYNSMAILDATRSIVGYKDGGNSDYGTACVLSVSGATITPDTPAVFESAATNFISTSLLDSGHVVVSYQDTGDSSYGTAKVLNGIDAIYVSNQHVSAVTNSSGQINTEFFTDLNSLTPSDTLNGEEANYGITTDGITYEIVGDGESTLRNVVKFDTVWKYNSNVTYGSETWTAASVDDLNVAIEEAMGVAQNQMNSATAAAVIDATWPAFGLIFGIFMAVQSTDSAVTPTVESISFNYDGNIEPTRNYNYSDAHMDLDVIKITSPSGGSTINAKVRVIKA